MKFRIKEQGGALHLVIIVVLVVAVLGSLGFVLWQNSIQKNDLTTDVVTTETSDSLADPTSEQNLPVSYAMPNGSKISTERFDNDDYIHVGYGAPVFLKYSTSDGWMSYETDESNEPTIKQDNNLVRPLAIMAENQYIVSYYFTGDGPEAVETRILVVVNDDTYQFSFYMERLSEQDITKFVESIVFE